MEALWFVGGFVLGGLIIYLILTLKKKELENSFSTLSRNALNQNSKEFIELARNELTIQSQAGISELDTKKKLIDQRLDLMAQELEKVKQSVTVFDNNSGQKMTEVNTQLKNVAERTKELQETTNRLHNVLGSSQTRGQWGERMAEDILRLIGFKEGINYTKQKALGEVTSRPDYTFILPQELKLNMDVKFPWENYQAFISEENPTVKEEYKQRFLKDVRQRVKEVTSRDYINPQEHTLNYVLVFIPNEQVYCFINENDPKIMDDALKNKVVLCSPFTLYSVLAVIRQAIDNFNLTQMGSLILKHLEEFDKQWQLFKESMDKMGRRLDDARNEFINLTSTRTNRLDKTLMRVDELRLSEGLRPLTENYSTQEELEQSDS